MKKILLFAGCCAALSMVVLGNGGRGASRPAGDSVKHVVLIGVDGFGIRNIAWDRMPNLRKLRDRGMFAVARSTFPTAAAPWARRSAAGARRKCFPAAAPCSGIRAEWG